MADDPLGLQSNPLFKAIGKVANMDNYRGLSNLGQGQTAKKRGITESNAKYGKVVNGVWQENSDKKKGKATVSKSKDKKKSPKKPKGGKMPTMPNAKPGFPAPPKNQKKKK